MSSKAGKRRRDDDFADDDDDDDFEILDEEPAPRPAKKKAATAASGDKKPRAAPKAKADAASVKAGDTGGSLERNRTIAGLLRELASQTSAKVKDDPKMVYVYRALEKAADAIAAAPFPIQEGKQAMKVLAGVGKGTAEKIDEIIRTGTLAALEKGREDPRTRAVTEFQRVHGIGMTTAGKLYDEHNITSLEELMTRPDLLDAGQAVALKYLASLETKVPRAAATTLFSAIQRVLKKVDASIRVELCGAFRRGKAEDDDIYVVVTHPSVSQGEESGDRAPKLSEDAERVMTTIVDALTAHGVIVDTMAHGHIKYSGVCKQPTEEELEHGNAGAAAAPAPAEAAVEAPAPAPAVAMDFEIPDIDAVDAATNAAAPKTILSRDEMRGKAHVEGGSAVGGAAGAAITEGFHRLVIQMVAASAWTAGVFTATGSLAFVNRIRATLKEKGFKLSEHGLRKVTTEKVAMDVVAKATASKGTKAMFAKPKAAAASAAAAEPMMTEKEVIVPIPVDDERALFAAVDLPYEAPNEREA